MTVFIRLIAFLAGIFVLFYILRQFIEDIKVKLNEIMARRFEVKPVEEPHSEMLKDSKKMLFKIKLPGIGSEKNIRIRKLGNSIEVRAYSKDKTYFKMFQVPKNSKITAKKLEGEELAVEIGT